MPRPKKPGSAEPKTRSRHGCWPCKTRKIKCDEGRPSCQNCDKQNDYCDYSIRLNWDGRSKRKSDTSRRTVSAQSGFINISSPPSNGGVKRKSTEEMSNVKSSPVDERQYAALSARPASQASPSAQEFQGSAPSTVPGLLSLPSVVQPAGSPSDTDSPSPGLLPSQSSVARDHFSAAQLSRFRDLPLSYSSSTESNLESPPIYSGPGSTSLIPPQDPSRTLMPPPTFQYSAQPFSGSNDEFSSGPSPKRARFHSAGDVTISATFSQSPDTPGRPRSFDAPSSIPASRYGTTNSNNGITTASGISAVTPGTSVHSDESQNPTSSKTTPSSSVDASNVRRLSVKSLLSEDCELDPEIEAANPVVSNIVYGIDRGFPDQDVPKNNDRVALNGITPTTNSPELGSGGTHPFGATDSPTEFGFGLYGTDDRVQGDRYYRQPITVSIPRSLGSLPSTLLDNPMNLLYFHHFLNHTARILVPHDCIDNPFRSVLPRMALINKNLLNLLLAYSAGHRARFLKHPEPANRIALWVQGIFPSLSRALDDPSEQLSDANLATAIMLASLEIISPNTFEVPISWQSHLNVARRMILARGVTHRTDQISYFLSRWFAYLDILGSLSGGRSEDTLVGGKFWASDDQDSDESDFQIDCLTGFTSRCIVILAKVAELARDCDRQRINDRGEIDQDWCPSGEMKSVAEQLRNDLREARLHEYRGCPYRNPDPAEDLLESREMAASNAAFHWAGLIHLDRRVLGKTSADAEVQLAVNKIISALDKIRRGGTAEACLVFPMFTAGCEANEEEERLKILERMQIVEGSGMIQVREARRLMERVWESGMPWEFLVAGEFVG